MHASLLKEFDLATTQIQSSIDGFAKQTAIAITERATGKQVQVLIPVLTDDVDRSITSAITDNFKDSAFAQRMLAQSARRLIELQPDLATMFGELTHTFMRKCMGGHMSVMHRMIYDLMNGPTWHLMCTEAITQLKALTVTSERNVAATIRDAWTTVLAQASRIDDRYLTSNHKELKAAGWDLDELENMSLRQMQAFKSTTTLAGLFIAVIPWEDWKTLAWSLQK